MACDNLLNSNNVPYKPQRTLASVHFNDISEKSPEQDWQYKGTKHRQNMLAQKEHTNAAVWEIDNLERLLVEIEKDSKKV